MEDTSSDFIYPYWAEYFEECNICHKMGYVMKTFNEKALRVIDHYGMNTRTTISQQTLLEIIISFPNMIKDMYFDTIKHLFDMKPHGEPYCFYLDKYFFDCGADIHKLGTHNPFLDMLLIFFYKSGSHGWHTTMFGIQFESIEEALFYEKEAFKKLIYFIYRLVMTNEVANICSNMQLHRKTHHKKIKYSNVMDFLEDFMITKPRAAIPYIIITNQMHRSSNLMKMVFKELNKKI